MSLVLVRCWTVPDAVGASALRPVVPGTYDAVELPPLRVGRAASARGVTPRVLDVEVSWWQATHGELARRGGDPQLASLEGLVTRALHLDLEYGLHRALSARARLRWLRLSGGGGRFEGGRVGPGDVDLALAVAPGRGRRWTARIETGVTLALGSGTRYRPDGGLIVHPFSVGRHEPFVAGAVRLRLSGDDAPVAIDLHGSACHQWRATRGAGEAIVPFPERLPLVSLASGGRAFDRLELSAALSFTRGSTVLVSAVDWPLVRGAGDLLAGSEVPRALTQGFRTGVGDRLALALDLSFPFASDAPATGFDPIAAYPEWSLRVGLAFELVPVDGDRDGDRVGDTADRCPDVAEDRDGFADADGCPDPDDDGDGVIDALDACPRVAEDRDGFEDADGCPELDNDQDGIPDLEDDCPGAAEDVDGFEDDDGCPDLDNDQDGISDVDDMCPDDPEDEDGIEDDDGCPE